MGESLMEKHHWTGEEPQSHIFFGFIYEIIDNKNSRRYIGKKQYVKANPQRRVKNRPSMRNSSKWKDYHWLESDWAFYTGSSKELNTAIHKDGKANFEFVILSQHDSRGSLHYAEIDTQVKKDVLRLKNEEGEFLYYNKQIAGVRFRPPSSHSEETIAKLKHHARTKHPMKGKVHPNKGKKLPQCAPKNPKAKGSVHVTNGVDNKWAKEGEEVPKGWRRGLTRSDKGRELTTKEMKARKEASKIATENAHQRLALKSGFKDYGNLVDYIVKSVKTRQELSKELGIGWTTVDRIRKRSTAND